jgi:Flp pilus assembly pilin Flp
MKKLSLITRIRDHMKNEAGQSTTEYILILAIVVMLAGKVRTKLTSTVVGSIDQISSDLNTFNSQNQQ